MSPSAGRGSIRWLVRGLRFLGYAAGITAIFVRTTSYRAALALLVAGIALVASANLVAGVYRIWRTRKG